MRTLFLLALLNVVIVGCAGVPRTTDNSTANSVSGSADKVVVTSDVEWESLNPARGDKSPRAGTLWGDRSGTGPTGFLVQFVDGFSSPPHIHNVSYRGVVISGHIHNDDPNAENMWMPTGSFWTQPKGEAHITAAKGRTNVAYIEIEEGPYLVLPVEEAFDSGERPINVDESNIVWIDPPNVPGSVDGLKQAFLWGSPQDDQLNGTLVKLPPGFFGEIRSHGSTLRAVVIQGQVTHRAQGAARVNAMKPGSYFSLNGQSVHEVSCDAGDECIIYVRIRGKYDVRSVQPVS